MLTVTDPTVEKLYCSVKEAAIMLSCCEHTVRRLCETGELTARRMGRCWKVSKKGLEEYVNAKEGGKNV